MIISFLVILFTQLLRDQHSTILLIVPVPRAANKKSVLFDSFILAAFSTSAFKSTSKSDAIKRDNMINA